MPTGDVRVPHQAWIVIIALMGVILAIVGYVYPGTDTARQFIFGAANSLISGAIGAFTASSTAKVTTGGVTGEAIQGEALPPEVKP